MAFNFNWVYYMFKYNGSNCRNRGVGARILKGLVNFSTVFMARQDTGQRHLHQQSGRLQGRQALLRHRLDFS